MVTDSRLNLPDIEHQVCDIASKQLGFPREKVLPSSRLIEDLHCDSLDLIDLIMSVEEAFSVTLPNDPPNAVCKTVFTRQPFRLSDLAELVYLQQGTGRPERSGWRRAIVNPSVSSAEPFTQLGGKWDERQFKDQSPFEPLNARDLYPQFRRRIDGMRILLPSAEVEIGSNDHQALPDEQPLHVVELDAVLIDAEPVSTTAYCRFLNSVDSNAEYLTDWFVLDPQDDRQEQMVIGRSKDEWQPVAGMEHVPVVLVSWYGANAYSLWANGCEWAGYRDSEGFLPSEAQWEYAARGRTSQSFPSGDASHARSHMACAQHECGNAYQADTMPLAAVNTPLGMSPFGLHHMAGNVWQWCRDWYDEAFYLRPESVVRNPVNRKKSGVRSERGGSWVGPAELCRSSYRRGRVPTARGRCLGFRCISETRALLPLT